MMFKPFSRPYKTDQHGALIAVACTVYTEPREYQNPMLRVALPVSLDRGFGSFPDPSTALRDAQHCIEYRLVFSDTLANGYLLTEASYELLAREYPNISISPPLW